MRSLAMRLEGLFTEIRDLLFLEFPEISSENVPECSRQLSVKVSEMLTLTFVTPDTKRARLLICSSVRETNNGIHPGFIIGEENVSDVIEINELHFDDNGRAEIDVDKYLEEKNIKHGYIDRDALKKWLKENSGNIWCEIAIHDNGKEHSYHG